MKKNHSQTELFLHERENNPTSEAVLKQPKTQKDLKAQTTRIFNLLMGGKTLTVTKMFVTYKIMSPPRRIADIKLNGYRVSVKPIRNSRRVVYYMSTEDVTYNKYLQLKRKTNG